jgi:predicted N-acyltransferase
MLAAAPAYLREESDGDFSRDWGWAAAAERGGVPFYPKLCVTVPFTPVTGRRLLIAPGVDRMAAVEALGRAAVAVAREAGAQTVQFLFPTAAEADELASVGFARRIDFQFHWNNAGYQTPADFLARFNAKKRHQARRERAAPVAQGISLRTIRGEELAKNHKTLGRLAHDLHRSTVDKLMWGRRWLNRAFYDQIFATMPEPLELVVAEREGKVVAGAFNVASTTRLFGRYWGCFEDHPFLHFNVCLYHSIDDCIARGLEAMEGGAGGEHKIARGFLPAETFSAHAFLSPQLDKPLRAVIAQEAAQRHEALTRFQKDSPILKAPAPRPGLTAK